MRRSLTALVFAAVAPATFAAQSNDAFLATFRDSLDALRIQTAIPGLSAAIIGRDDVLWMHAYGRQDAERNIPASVDTVYHLDGLTQIFTATLFLRCAELGILTLDESLGQWFDDVPDPGATIAQLLTHTTLTGGETVFVHAPQRLAPLVPVYRRGCQGDSFRETLSLQFEMLGMGDSVPGPDVLTLEPPAEGIPSPSQIDRYTLALARLATPYTVTTQRRTFPSVHTATTLTPTGGALSTVRDYARFDLALKRGEVLRPETLNAAWQPPMGRNGTRLSHGMGWFVQTYNGEPIVWQFGVNDSGSSSMVMMAPRRGLTLVLLANSPGLVRPFALDKGDVVASPFGRLFLGMLVR
jgi:CubicO group peptidase (beta-lactamase class C family)